MLENLQYTWTRQLDRDVYAMAYGGLLENMFGGVGGEVLYRPFDSSWAIGVDANWVKQRGFRQDFSFRDYSTWTGHVTTYNQTPFWDVLVRASAGRYLAGDYGGTLDLSRRKSSVRAASTKVSISRFPSTPSSPARQPPWAALHGPRSPGTAVHDWCASTTCMT